MDKASVYGTEDSRFDPWRGQRLLFACNRHGVAFFSPQAAHRQPIPPSASLGRPCSSAATPPSQRVSFGFRVSALVRPARLLFVQGRAAAAPVWGGLSGRGQLKRGVARALTGVWRAAWFRRGSTHSVHGRGERERPGRSQTERQEAQRRRREHAQGAAAAARAAMVCCPRPAAARRPLAFAAGAWHRPPSGSGASGRSGGLRRRWQGRRARSGRLAPATKQGADGCWARGAALEPAPARPRGARAARAACAPRPGGSALSSKP